MLLANLTEFFAKIATNRSYRILLRMLSIIRQELAARDYPPAEGSENGGILYGFPVF